MCYFVIHKSELYNRCCIAHKISIYFVKKFKVVSQMLSHTPRRRFCYIVSVMLIVLLLPLGLPQASSDVPVPSVGFLSSWRAGRDPAKHPINQSVVPVPQCQPPSHSNFVLRSRIFTNAMNILGNTARFLFLICANCGSKIYEWDDLKNPTFPYSSLEVNFRSLFTFTILTLQFSGSRG